MNRQNHALLGALALVAALLFGDPRPAWAGFCILCGSNAATVGDGVVFDELNLEGRRRRGGPAIKEVMQISTKAPARLVVKGDKLSAIVAGKTLTGPQLTDILIVLALENGRQFELTLTSYDDHLHYWASPEGSTPAYDFFVKERQLPGSGGLAAEHRLCTGQHIEETIIRQPDDQFAAMVFEGDHYSDKHVVSSQETGWFNLACFGTAAAKMHLLRYTRAGAEAGGARPPSLERRTTMLRAITADYCGDGRSWTGDGTPLVWTEKEQQFPLSIQPDFRQLQFSPLERQVEAAWGPNGRLLCLDEPRRTPTSTAKPCTSPGVRRADVVRGPIACRNARRLPRCDASLWSGKPANPWSGPPLAGAAGGPATPLSDATVLTVNRPTTGNNYCEGIRWR